jgi:hypothetical protein
MSEHSAYKPSRRDFLKALPAAALAEAACRRRPYRSEDFVIPDRSPMAILPASSYDADLTDVISRGLKLLGADVRGKSVFLKPNMVEYESDTIINTNPRVVAAAADAFLKAGAAAVTVGEGPGHRRDIECAEVEERVGRSPAAAGAARRTLR